MMVSLSIGAVTSTAKIVAPIIAGGIIGEFIDQSGQDEALINAIPFVNNLPANVKPFVPITVALVALSVFGGAAALGKNKWGLNTLAAGAAVGIMTNYAAKMVLKTGGSK